MKLSQCAAGGVAPLFGPLHGVVGEHLGAGADLPEEIVLKDLPMRGRAADEREARAHTGAAAAIARCRPAAERPARPALSSPAALPVFSEAVSAPLALESPDAGEHREEPALRKARAAALRLGLAGDAAAVTAARATAAAARAAAAAAAPPEPPPLPPPEPPPLPPPEPPPPLPPPEPPPLPPPEPPPLPLEMVTPVLPEIESTVAVTADE